MVMELIDGRGSILRRMSKHRGMLVEMWRVMTRKVDLDARCDVCEGDKKFEKEVVDNKM